MPRKKPKKKSKKLNIYKLKSSLSQFEEIIFPTKSPPFEIEAEKLDGNFQYKLFVQRNKKSEPHWYNLLRPILQEDVFSYYSSFVMLVRIQKDSSVYFFALTGGFSAYSLISKYIEEGFGLKIAERTINPQKIKHITQTAFIGSDRQILRSVQSYNPEYDLENQRRIMRSLDGQALNPDLVGFSISGADSLSVRKPIDFSELDEYFSKLIELYNSDEVLVKLPRTFRVIRDREEMARLNSQLLNQLKDVIEKRNDSQFFEYFFVGYRNFVDFLKCYKFEIAYRSKRITIEDELDVSHILSFIKENNIPVNLDDLKCIRIRGTGEESYEEIIPSTNLLYFLYSEVPLGQRNYFLIDAKWYELDLDHKKYIDQRLLGIPRESILPLYDHSIHRREDNYNRWVPSQDSDYVCLHGGFVSGRIEICDLYKKSTNSFVHVKRGWGAPLSHLFAQGLVSAYSFASSPNYRRQCHARNSAIPSNFITGKHEVVFAIIHLKANNSDFPKNMTYFSKINLLSTIDNIAAWGFRPKLSSVMVQ